MYAIYQKLMQLAPPCAWLRELQRCRSGMTLLLPAVTTMALCDIVKHCSVDLSFSSSAGDLAWNNTNLILGKDEGSSEKLDVYVMGVTMRNDIPALDNYSVPIVFGNTDLQMR